MDNRNMQDMLLDFGVIASIMMELAGRRQIIKPDTAEAIRQHMPGFLGLGNAGKQIWVALVAHLTKEEFENVTKLESIFNHCQGSEFRLVVTGAPVGTVTREKDGKKTVGLADEFSSKDNRVRFLKDVAQMVKENGAEAVKQMLITNQLIGRDENCDRLIAWFEKNLREFFELTPDDPLSKIDEALIAKKIDELAGAIPTCGPFDWNPITRHIKAVLGLMPPRRTERCADTFAKFAKLFDVPKDLRSPIPANGTRTHVQFHLFNFLYQRETQR